MIPKYQINTTQLQGNISPSSVGSAPKIIHRQRGEDDTHRPSSGLFVEAAVQVFVSVSVSCNYGPSIRLFWVCWPFTLKFYTWPQRFIHPCKFFFGFLYHCISLPHSILLVHCTMYTVCTISCSNKNSNYSIKINTFLSMNSLFQY